MSEMTDWFSSNEAAVQAISSIIQGVAVIALVAVTGVYAYFTRRMARELREQTLAQDRPGLLIDLANAEEIEWHEPKGEEEQADPWLHMHPKTFICRIHNAGRHAAKEVAVTVMHPSVTYDAPRKGFLLPEDTWETSVRCVPSVRGVLEPCGLSKWVEAQGPTVPKPPPTLSDTGVVVYYRDIHDVDWATYLVFVVVKAREVLTQEETAREVLVRDQRLIRAKHRRLPPVTIRGVPR